MTSALPSPAIFPGIAVSCSLLLTACTTPGGSAGTATVPVAQVCSLMATSFMSNPQNNTPVVSDRTDPNSAHGFTRFRALSGRPQGNPAIGFTPDAYGSGEAWLRNPVAPTVFRAQAHPARRPAFNDFKGSAWSIRAQDATGTWSRVFATGSANQGNEQDDPATGGVTVPQLMPVGLANPQMFACAGTRSMDDAVRTTALIEVKASNVAAGTSNSVDFIQDLLNGDDRFVRNAPGPLVGPSNPPTPTIRGPGHPIRDGAVKCAMTQFEDDLATRELHMLAISNGVLYHSMASTFGPAVSGSGFTFNRFNTVPSWGDVGQALGGGFGNIVSATILASRPTAISVFFVAESGGRHRLFHAVRFSANGGSWRPADDVLALNGGTLNGTNFPFRIAAGTCPVFGQPQDSEIVYAMWDADRIVQVGRVVSTPQQWAPGVQGIYPPLNDISRLLAGTSDTSRNHIIESMTIAARPFRDDALPPP